jgi:hypothetical protein
LEKVTFDLFGLTLLEPLSVLTNWAMAWQCFYYVYKLDAETDYQKLWGWFFKLYAWSFVFGGFSHLLFNYSAMAGKIPGWSCALLGVTLAEWGMTTKFEKAEVLRVVIVVKLITSVSLLFIDFKFLWVMLHTTGLLFFVGIPAIIRFTKGHTAYKYFIYSIFSLLLTAPIKLLKIDIHPAYFNRDDISHVFMIIAIWMMFKGARKTAGSSAASRDIQLSDFNRKLKVD